jgi:hypothetical protein
MSNFSHRKIMERPVFLDLLSKKMFNINKATRGSERMYKLKPILDHQNAKFRSVYTPEGDVSLDESLMM